MNKQLIQKIISKKEYSQLPEKDVKLAFERFNKEKYSDEEKIKFTRKLLRDIFSSFTSQKLLSLKDKDALWVLRKHLSTRERLPYYAEIYERVLQGFDKNLSIIDLGAGVNGFSYKFLQKYGKRINYLAIEAMGQLVNLMNSFFNKEDISGKAIQLSLFELEKVKKEIKKMNSPRIVFLFKIIDSLETLKKDYSKELILEVGNLADKVVVSFATKSMGKGIRFRAKRDWIIEFIKDNFNVMDDFELGGERYLIFSKSRKIYKCYNSL